MNDESTKYREVFAANAPGVKTVETTKVYDVARHDDYLDANARQATQPVGAVRGPDTAPPRWYTQQEIEHCLQRMSYSEAVIAELAPWFFRHIKSAFDKGYNMAMSNASLAQPLTTSAQPKLIGWRMADYTHETDSVETARN